MADEKITIDWNDLRTRQVDNRLREQGAMERNRTYAQMREDALPVASAPAKGTIWNNAIFCMMVFGLIGGLLAWGTGALIVGPLAPVIGSMLHYQPTAKAEAEARLADLRGIEVKLDTGRITAAEGAAMSDEVRTDGQRNAYFRVAADPRLSTSERQTRTAELEAGDRFALFVINTISYGQCGLMLALCLAIAEPLTQRKIKNTLINGIMGAIAGLAGGVAAALLTDRMATFAGLITEGQAGWIKQLASQAAIWGMLGLFLGLGSGLALRSGRKLLVGALGGLVGGMIGGALLHPINVALNNEQIGRGVALIAIGMVAGIATGLLENVIKAGWLKVTSGIIAGKQFILYRNPTYIGSSPDCQIYLFKDNEVGRRHAAIHLTPGGIEIEDLPLGGPTIINGKSITRARLKNDDAIQIGATSFRFQEKRPASGK